MTKDLVKTLAFAGLAILGAGLAFAVSLPRADEKPEDFVGKPLFVDFTDPTSAAQLEIVKVDEKLGKLQTFQVDRSPQGNWVIPSHGGYPADATEQMRDAATSLINLNVLAKVSDLPGDQEMYGVVQPEKSRVEAGEQGFGMVVDFKDKDGKDLAGLIIGKKVQDSESQHFVRKIGQDPIYVVDINTAKLSTKFSDWIEKDLLKVSPWDIDRVTIKDYQFQASPQEDGRIIPIFDPRMDMTVGWDEKTNTWILDKLTQYHSGQAAPGKLNDDEELNKEKLDELKSAIDNLLIVDVQPKPQGLGGDLSVDDAARKNAQLNASLHGLGFMAVPRGKKAEFLGTNGEVNIGLKDGVEYVLRFGNSAGADSADGKSKRYVFVLARLDESRLQPPALEELPEAPADVPAASEGEKKDDAAAGGDEKKGEEKPKESEFDLKRKRIERDNQRKLDDYQERRKKAAAKVRELNARFAPWYYIISDDEFKKVHLTRAEAVKEKTGSGVEGYGPDAFRDLQEGGIKPPPPPMPAGGPGFQGLPPGLQIPGGN